MNNGQQRRRSCVCCLKKGNLQKTWSPPYLAVTCNATHNQHKSAPINSRLNVVVRSPTPFVLGRNGCWPFRGSQLPWARPFIFRRDDRSRAEHSFFKIGRLFSLHLPVFVSSFFSFT